MNRFVKPPKEPVKQVQLKDWILSAQAGEQRGQQYIYEAFAPGMLLAIRRYISGEQEALDVLQDGFIKVFGNIGGYTFKGSFEGWLRRIMVHMAIDALRANKQLQWVGENEELLDVFSDRQRSDEGEGPEWAGLDYRDVFDAMDELSPMYRAVFNLYALEDHSHREISERLGISEGTSKSNYAKARRNLRDTLRRKLKEK